MSDNILTEKRPEETDAEYEARHQWMREEASVKRVLEKACHRMEIGAQDIPATFALIGTIVLIYGMTSFPNILNGPQAWMEPGMFYTPAVNQGEWWRFFSANFLHAGIMHLVMNSIAIWLFGRQIEGIIGIKNQLLLFLVTGLSATGLGYAVDMAPYWFGGEEYTQLNPAFYHFRYSLGASGIGYGLMGACFTFYLLIRKKVLPLQFKHDLRGLVILILVYTGLNVFRVGQYHVWGHLGGFLGGILFATVYFQLLINKARKQWMGWGIDTQL